MAHVMQPKSNLSSVVFLHIPPVIRRAADLSIAGLIESLRIAILVTPIIFSVPQLAKANTVETVEYEIVEEDAPQLATSPSIARFGPFSVVSQSIAELNGETGPDTPAQFRRMLATYPHISLIRMIECAGTVDDEANLEVARMIRRAGISTHVPAGGSVRSGGVELFLAGVQRTHDKGAEFGVHSWEDDEGRQARDVPGNDGVNAEYINYYQSVGLKPETARAFYAFTNATAADRIHYMTESELARFGLTN
jgi:hypothetical protein